MTYADQEGVQPALVARIAELEAELAKTRESLAVAERVCRAAEAYELEYLKKGKVTKRVSVVYASALEEWRQSQSEGKP